jgi:phosphonate transport system substrate-binding protein
MWQKTILGTCVIAAGALLGGVGQASANTDLTDVCPDTIRMADTGLKGMGPLDQAFGPFAEVFQEKTGLQLKLYSLSNRTAAGNALQYDEVDLVFAGPSEFVLFQQEVDDGVEILFDIKRPYYGTTFLTKASTDIKDLEDLEGKHIALKDVGSTSGHIWPTKMLVDAGLDPDEDLQITMAGDAFVHALVNGDVVAIGGGNDDADYIREELDPDTDYRVIAKSDPLPGDPVVIRSDMARECKSQLTQALKANREELWQALVSTERNKEKFLNRGSEMGFSLTAEDYQVIREAYDAAGIELGG